MVWVEKDFPYFLANRAPTWFSGYFTMDAFLGEIFFQALNLSGLTTPLYTFESNKERQFYYPPNESKSLAGCSKTPICGVVLILRRCSVHPSTPHSSGFRAPCIWAFLSSLKKIIFSAGC
jgi:hypothetical protein